jgi:hypothetical protein
MIFYKERGTEENKKVVISSCIGRKGGGPSLARRNFCKRGAFSF